jgi:hypothetical protein
MRSFSEVIVESFRSEVKVTWKLRSVTHAIAAFTVKSLAVEVSFEQREHNGPWHVGFNTMHVDTADRTNLTLAFRVFNGVFQAIREFIDTREPEILVLIAKDEDLASVYETYLQREEGALDELGYKLEGPHRVEPYTEWTVRRIRPSSWECSGQFR